MVKTFILLLSIFSSTFASPQDSTVLKKWKNAVIELETRSLDTTGYARFDSVLRAYLDTLSQKRSRGEINVKQQLDSMANFRYYNPRSSEKPLLFYGTALFLKNNGKRYLITAKHVLNDKSEADWRFKYHADKAYDSTKVFQPIFRVRSYDEILSGRRASVTQYELALFNNPPRIALPYTFSSDELDLAVWSLDNPYMRIFDTSFAKNLEINGYAPIDLKEVADEPFIEGENIFSIGFPTATSFIGIRRDMTSTDNIFATRMVSEPMFCFGKIAMNNKAFPYFWVDMSIYPGNSGGPIVDNNKLVGIVSAQAAINIEYKNNPIKDYSTRIPFGRIIKAKYIKQLIKTQETKDVLAEEEIKKIK